MTHEKGIILLTVDPWRIGKEGLEALRAAGGGREVVHAWEKADIEKYLEKTEIMMGWGPWDMVMRMPRLAWFQLWSAGADGLLGFPELRQKDFILTNTSGMHREQIAEHIFALILAWNHLLYECRDNQKKREWARIADPRVPVLGGASMVILGYGAIGEQAGRAAKAFNMKVTGVRRRPADSASDADGVRIVATDDMDSVLKDADYIVNILPNTPLTQGLISREKIARFKKGAVFVNVGRGGTVDEAALIDALKTGQVGAALLDVTAQEPLPASSPLWEMPNVIITPHSAGARSDYDQEALRYSLENLARYVKGEPLLHLVDKNAGY